MEPLALAYNRIHIHCATGSFARIPIRALLLMGFAGRLSACRPSPKTPTAKYLALGDSYTIGERVAPDDRWPLQLAHQLRDAGIDLGAPQIVAETGWTTADLAAGMDAARLTGPYQLVTLLIGVDNQFRGQSSVAYRQEFHEKDCTASCEG